MTVPRYKLHISVNIATYVKCGEKDRVILSLLLALSQKISKNASVKFVTALFVFLFAYNN